MIGFPTHLRRLCRSAVILLAGSIPLLAATAAAQSRTLGRFTITMWTQQMRPYASEINAITQGSDGYLWLATDGGLLQFDGVRFVKFDGLDDLVPLSTVFRSRDGSIWVGGTSNGVARVKGRQITPYSYRNGFTGRQVIQFAEDDQGVVYAASANGLFRFVNGQSQRLGAQDGLPVAAASGVYHDSMGTLWVATPTGVFNRTKGRSSFQVYDAAARAPLADFAEFPSGTVWRTDSETGFREVFPLSGVRPDARGAGINMMTDSAGQLWLTTAGAGVWVARKEGLRIDVDRLTASVGLPLEPILSIFEDQERNIWLGARGGLIRLVRRRVSAPTDPAFSSAERVIPGRGNDMWIGTTDRVARINSGEVRWWGRQEGVDGPIQAMHVDNAGALWFATTSSLLRLADDRVTRLPLKRGAWPSSITAIAVDWAGAAWITDAQSGLLRWADGDVAPVDPSKSISHTAVNHVATDRDRRVWLVLQAGGLGYLDRKGAFSLVHKSDDQESPTAVHQDDSGVVWFAARNRLLRFQDGIVKSVRLQSGTSRIRGMANDGMGHLWLISQLEWLRIDLNDVDRAIENPSFRVNVRRTGGNSDIDAPMAMKLPGAAVGPNQTLWLIGRGGLYVMDPRRLLNDVYRPPVRIETIQVDGQALAPTQRLTLPAGAHNVQIGYRADTLTNPALVTFEYQLEGFDSTPTDAGVRQQAFYTKLPPGDYRFRVRAQSPGGAWSDTPTVLEFSVDAFFYQQAWFWLLIAAALSIAVWSAWRMHIRRVRHDFVLVITERVRMSRAIHDTLLQGLVAVALKLQGVMHIEGIPPTLRSELTRMRREVETYIRDSRRSIWSLRSTPAGPQDLADRIKQLGARFAEPEGIAVDFAVNGTPHKTSREIEEELTYIAREAIVNAVRHARPQHIRIKLEYDAEALTLRIEDDGRGFDASAVDDSEGQHCGLTTMRERASEIAGSMTLSTQTGAGTAIEVVVPTASQKRARPAGASAAFSWDPPLPRKLWRGAAPTQAVSHDVEP